MFELLKKGGVGIAGLIDKKYLSLQAEDALQESAEYVKTLLASIVNSSDDAIIAKTLDGIIISWNKGAERIYGYSAEDVLGEHISILIPPYLPDEAPGILGKIKRGEHMDHYETVRVRKDGRQISVSLTISPIKDASGKITGASTIARDITERKKLDKSETERRQFEEVAHEARIYAESIVETVREPLVVLDAELKVLSANRSFYHTFNVTPDETIGNFIYDIGNRQWDIPSLRMLLEEILTKETVFDNFEVEHDFPTIGQKTMLLNARLIYQKVIGIPMILLAIEDITEKRRMEDELTKYREHIEQLVEERTTELNAANERLSQEVIEHKQAEEALQKSYRRISVLYSIDRAAARSLNLDDILDKALDVTLVALGVETGGIYLLLPDGENMKLHTHRGFSEEFVKNLQRIKLGEDVSGRAAIDKKPVAVDVSEYPTERLAPFIVREGLQTVASTPLLSGGKLIGALNLGTRRAHAFPPEEIELLASIGQQLGMAAQNALLYEQTMQELVERRRAEEALRESEAKYRNLVESIQDIVYTGRIDEKTLASSITFMSGQAESILGLMPEDFFTDPELWTHSIHPDDLPLVSQQTENALKQGVTCRRIYRMKNKKSGEYRWLEDDFQPVIDEQGQTIGFFGTVRDITGRMEAEEKIAKAHRQNELILSSAGEGIYGLDSSGKVTFFNNAAAKMLGFEVEDVIGRSSHETWNHARPNGTGYPMEECPVCATYSNGVSCIANEAIFWRKDGTGFPVEFTSTPISEGGNITGAVVVFRDITERRKSEEMRLENLRLEAADKAKSEFLASMSHELRTPLNAIIGFSELLKLKIPGELNEKQKRYVEDILTSGNHLLALINDILDLSKVEAGKVELVIEKLSVPQAVNEGLTLVKEKAMRHDIKLKTELDPELEFIEADRLRFKQILFNLLSNAVKFSKPEGGIVTVKTKKEGETARISVSDTGIGIKEEDMGKLFKEFEQISSGISRRYGGTGLGLAISKKLVELHGGKISAESRYGEGSTFTFLLPLKAKTGDE